MNKLIVIFFLLNILNIYCQLSCSQYTDSTCGGYTSFKLKCHKFRSSCEGIEVDDGCTINESNQCVKEDGVTLGENEICFNYTVATKCRRIKDQCTSYIDSNCGGKKGTKGSIQCTKMSNNANDFCHEIEIDQYCEVNDLFRCEKRSNVTEANFDQKYSCSFNADETTCKREAKVCSKQLELHSNCEDMMPLDDSKQCRKVTINNKDICKEITVSGGCTVSNAGVCSATATLTNPDQKCSFDDQKDTCRPISKTCEDYSDNCSGKPVTSNGKTCYHKTSSCKEVTVESTCEIKNGVCGVPEDITTYECKFDEENNICRKKTCEDYDSDNCSEKPVKLDGKTCYKIKLGGTPFCKEVEIDEENCEINDNEVCSAPENITTHECLFDEENNICRKKTCKDTVATTLAVCNAIQLSDGICSGVRDGGGKCKEVTIHEKCDIADETNNPPFDCVDNNLNNENQKCDFNTDKTICEPRAKTCEEYNSENCSGKTVISSGKTCSKVKDVDNCKEVKIEDKCTIDGDGNCKLQNSYTSGYCDFNGLKNECYFIPCNEIIDLTKCEATPGCGYYSQYRQCKEVTVDKDNCQISSGVCSDKVATDNKECLFNYEITDCRKRDKTCSNYFENTCGNIQITLEKQCYKFSGSHYCKEIQVDEKCNVNNDECVERSGATGIPEDKICHFTDDTQTSCKLVDKKCEEYTTQTCKNLTYTNSNKKCFYYSDSGRCHEVELDNYCTVDQDGDCVEKDDSLSDTETCGYTNSSETECKKRNRVCNELDIDICESYTPINNKFCFNFGSGCTEVTVEDGCQMNSANQCVAKRKGDACSLDDNNSRCYKTKSGASLLNLKLFSLLILFFIC